MYNIYRITSIKELLAKNVSANQIGILISEDIARHFKRAMGTKAYGERVAKAMRDAVFPDWDLYPEDESVPTYRVVNLSAK